MNEIVIAYVKANQIDSFQKLQFLLSLYEQPQLSGTCQELAKRLYFGDLSLLTEIVTDLQGSGFVDCVEGSYSLCDVPDIQSTLQCLAEAYADPLVRQDMLAHVYQRK